MKNILLSLMLLFVYSCKTNNETVTIHPTEENINPDLAINNTITDNSGSEQNFLSEKYRWITDYTHILSVGKKYGEDYEMLGKVKDAFFDDETNQLYVLDEQVFGVMVYNSQGEYESTISRKGRGPGELVTPESFRIKGNKLYVLNNHFDVKVFEKNNTDEFEASAMIEATSPPDDFCISGNDIFIYTIPQLEKGEKERKSVQQINIDNFEVANNFGRIYKSKSEISTTFLSMGGIECTDGANEVVTYFKDMNFLFAYGKDGQIRWTTKFQDFNFLKIVEDGNMLGPDPKETQKHFNKIENLQTINEEAFFVQTGDYILSDGEYRKTYKTYVINFSDGAGIFISDQWPLILSSSNKEIVFLEDEEFSKVSVFKY